MDLTRSIEIFDPATLKLPIHVIGVGATGSHVVKGLILQGIPGNQIAVYDFDVVESHNVANQVYTSADIGKLKVDALAERVLIDYGQSIKTHNVKLKDASKLKGVVFLLIDGDRGPLFKTMKYRPSINLLIETGLDARAGRCNVFSPNNITHIKYYENKFISQEGSDEYTPEVSACGTRQVVVQTVNMLSSLAIWELIKWNKDPSYIGYDTFFSVEPYYIHSAKMQIQ